jgi:hypothetical protein
MMKNMTVFRRSQNQRRGVQMENSLDNRAGSAVASLLEDRFPYVDKSGFLRFL